MKKYLSLLIVCSLFFGFSFSQSADELNIESRKKRCPSVAWQINISTIGFVNETSPWVCCFEDGKTSPKCSQNQLFKQTLKY